MHLRDLCGSRVSDLIGAPSTPCYDFRVVPIAAPPTLDVSLYPATYRVSTGYAGFFYFLGGIAIAAGSLGSWYFATGHEMTSARQAAIMAALCFLFVLLGIFLIASIFRSTVTLRADAIVVQGMFSSRTLLRSEIAGRRILPTQYVKTLVLIPHSAHQKKLKLALALRTDPAFDAWFADIPDFDAKEVAESQADLNADPDLGFHSEDRKQRVAQAKQTAKVLNVIAWIALLWGFIAPRPYLLVISVLAALPIVSVVLLVRSRGIYQIEGRRNDARPSLAVPFIFPGMVLVARTVQDIHLLEWTSILVAAIVCALLLLLVVSACDRALRKRPWTAVIIFIFGAFYGWGLMAQANALLDTSPAHVFQVAVTGKHISSGKTTTYYLRLEPWGPETTSQDVSVPSSLYHYADVGVTVCVDLYPGAFRIPWYEIDRCR